MYQEYGALLGWLLVITISGSLMNYCVKFVAKRYMRNINKNSTATSVFKFFRIIFVRGHRVFGLIAILLLLTHFLIQFSTYGLNLTGGLAASTLIIQFILGVYIGVKKKTMKSPWFITHRLIALLLIFAISLHIISPNIFVASVNKVESVQTPSKGETKDMKTFTVEEVAKFNGKDGNKGYVIYKGVVYDVTNHPRWTTGEHNKNLAGTDLTDFISKSPHGDSKFKELEVVGKIK